MTDRHAGDQVAKVDITVAGHSVAIEAAEPLDAVAGKALDLFRQTAAYARPSTAGFAAPPAQVELAVHQDADEVRHG